MDYVEEGVGGETRREGNLLLMLPTSLSFDERFAACFTVGFQTD